MTTHSPLSPYLYFDSLPSVHMQKGWLIRGPNRHNIKKFACGIIPETKLLGQIDCNANPELSHRKIDLMLWIPFEVSPLSHFLKYQFNERQRQGFNIFTLYNYFFYFFMALVFILFTYSPTKGLIIRFSEWNKRDWRAIRVTPLKEAWLETRLDTRQFASNNTVESTAKKTTDKICT